MVTKKLTYIQKCRLMRFNVLMNKHHKVSFSDYFIFDRIVCFGELLRKRTL